MTSKRYPEPDTTISSEERAVIKLLAPVRLTLEKLVRQTHARAGGWNEDAYQADLESHWTLILAAYSRGVGGMRRGLHQAEGVDHEMIDQALAFALETTKEKS